MNQNGFNELMTKPREKHPHRKNYTDAERDLAMAAYVRAGGHKDRAAEALAAAGTPVPPSTIYYWATQAETERLERIRQELGPQLKAEMAEMHQGLAVAAGEIEAKAITRLNEKLDQDEIDGKDLSAVMQRSAIATGIHGEKQLLYLGQPTQIIQRKLPDVLRSLKSKGLDVGDVIDAEVVEETETAA